MLTLADVCRARSWEASGHLLPEPDKAWWQFPPRWQQGKRGPWSECGFMSTAEPRELTDRLWKEGRNQELFWNTNSQEYTHPYVHRNTICNQNMQAPQVPINRWVDKKLWYMYIMGYYSVIKEKWNLTICNIIDGPRENDAKWNKSDRERQLPYDYMISLTCRIWRVK